MIDEEEAELRREVREDLTLLQLVQDRLANVSMLNAALPGRSIISYEGPCRFALPQPPVCVDCGGRIDDLGYELRLHRGRVYLCQE